jgi:2-C-methyl-D-erythritol 4-phosphate cytidylyltransferase
MSPAARGVVIPAFPEWRLGGRSLLEIAADALRGADVRIEDRPGSTISDELCPMIVIHDAACPATPSAFIAECIAECRRSGLVVAAVLSVTDTVATVIDGAITAMVDRSTLWQLASPVVLPPGAAWKAGVVNDLASCVAEAPQVRLMEAPVSARRVDSPEDLVLLGMS